MKDLNIPTISGKAKHGIGRYNGEIMFLYKPTFDCGWYWGCGYIGNSTTHMHLNGVLDSYGNDWHTAFLNLFTDIPEVLNENLWAFIETWKTIYALRDVADIYCLGGSHISKPMVSMENSTMYKAIVEEQLPLLFESLVNMLETNNESVVS